MKGISLWMGLLAATLSLPVQAAVVEVEYIHTDALGTPIAVTDENGNVIERFEYEPYGLQVSGPVEDGPGYTGHVEDAATGLTYMQQRYYDPQIGMFLSVDPVTFSPNKPKYFNRYWYAAGNPYKYMDADGRCFGPLLIPCIAYAPAAADAAFVVGSAIVATVLIEDAVDHVMNNEQTESEDAADNSDVKIGEKIAGQIDERGWTEEEIQDITNTEPAGTSTDNTSGQNDSAFVYGTRDGGHVVVNDETNEVVQVSNKNDPNWVPDDRIKWKEE